MESPAKVRWTDKYRQWVARRAGGKSDSFPRKKVLVIEGGGMRGVFPTGVLQAFADRDYFPWKAVIGSSAGALTGAAYAAGQIYLARDAFFTELLSGKFICISNILNPEKHILNLDWMVNTIIKGDDPLRMDTLRRSCPVYITGTHCGLDSPPKTVYFNAQYDHIPTVLKATAAIPFLYRHFVSYKDYLLLDGALLDPVPFMKALNMGFQENDILVVVTRKKGYRKKEESFWVKRLYESYFKDPAYRYLDQTLDKRYQMYNQILDALENRYAGIRVIYPPEDFNVNRLTKDGEKILEGFEQGVAAAKEFLLHNP